MDEPSGIESGPLPNYYSHFQGYNDNTRFIIDPKEIISEIVDSLRGSHYIDNIGRRVYTGKNMMLNDEGVQSFRTVVSGIINKNTILSNYPDDESVEEQTKSIAKGIVMALALNHKQWNIKEPDLVQMICEQNIYSALQRARGGFQNIQLSKSHQTVETINQNPQKKDNFMDRVNPFKG